MRFKYKILALGLLLSVVACKKTELPPTVAEDPVFSVNATLGGMALDWLAGDDDYYLFTEYDKDQYGVFSFTGRFEKLANCQSDCQESLEFEIRDFQVTTGNSTDIGQALAPGTYEYVQPDSGGNVVLEGYEVQFENRSQSNIDLSYHWEFGDGETSNEAVPEKHFYPLSGGNIAVPVRLTIQDSVNTGACIQFAEKLVHLDTIDNQGPECQLTYTINPPDSAMMITVCASMTGVPPFTYIWDNDTTTTAMSSCSPPFWVNGPMPLDLFIFGIDAAGCLAVQNIALLTNPINTIPTYCSADFGYEVSARYSDPEGGDSLHLSRVLIRYTDQDGQVYRSDLGQQSTGNSFEILESTDYLENENGEKTRQLKVRFSGTLYAESGASIRLENGQGVIAVAYP